MRRTRTQWQQLFEEHKQSGMSIAAFCESRGLPPKYFSRRRSVMSRENNSSFVQAQVVTTDPSDTVIRLRYGSCHIEFSDSISTKRLAGLIKALS